LIDQVQTTDGRIDVYIDGKNVGHYKKSFSGYAVKVKLSGYDAMTYTEGEALKLIAQKSALFDLKER